MTENRWLYFALGVTTVISIGAVTNQLVPLAPATGVALSDTGITFPDGSVQTTAAPEDSRRSFYLRASPLTSPSQAPGACASGYHMASLWELLDVSNVRYATEHPDALNRSGSDDQGDGPPSNVDGWVRTGYFKQTLDNTPGRATCDGWTSSSDSLRGTSASLETDWSNAALIGTPWQTRVVSCAISTWRVWCAED